VASTVKGLNVTARIGNGIVYLSIATLPVMEPIIEAKCTTTEELSLEIVPRRLEAGVSHVLLHDAAGVHGEKALLENNALKFTTTIGRDGIENTRNNEEGTQDYQQKCFTNTGRDYLEDGKEDRAKKVDDATSKERVRKKIKPFRDNSKTLHLIEVDEDETAKD